MEKRIGTAFILVDSKGHLEAMNNILSMHSSIIIARQRKPLREKGVSVKSLILEGTNDQISTLTGKNGRVKGIRINSVLTKYE